jgi:hypothetical protein
MANFIQLSQELLSTLAQEYPFNDITIIQVGTVPEKVLVNYEMELYAQSREGTKFVNMRNPALKRELETLAALGPGHDMEWRGVIFRFVLGNNMLAAITYTAY